MRLPVEVRETEMLFNPGECSWCGADLKVIWIPPTEIAQEVYVRIMDGYHSRNCECMGTQPCARSTMQHIEGVYCSNSDCKWWDGLPARYESESGWKAMEDCWRD